MAHILYTYQTGKFRRTSSRGDKYQMIFLKIDSNSTWIKPTKNRTKGKIIISCDHALKRIHLCGLNPKNNILDNEASKIYK